MTVKKVSEMFPSESLAQIPDVKWKKTRMENEDDNNNNKICSWENLLTQKENYINSISVWINNKS